jgi:hypothetical protein
MVEFCISWLTEIYVESPSQFRPYCDVNATRNELVTTPTTFKNSKIEYHMPGKDNYGNVEHMDDV